MNKHKWHKEIKAWADGAEIEAKVVNNEYAQWFLNSAPLWSDPNFEFRIKPQPKEPQYLYAWENKSTGEFRLGENEPHPLKEYVSNWKCIGKIKLEQDNE